MLLHQDDKQHTVTELLDTGCSIALINQQTMKRLGIHCIRHNCPIQVERYLGEIVKGAGQLYTKPVGGGFQASWTPCLEWLAWPIAWLLEFVGLGTWLP